MIVSGPRELRTKLMCFNVERTLMQTGDVHSSVPSSGKNLPAPSRGNMKGWERHGPRLELLLNPWIKSPWHHDGASLLASPSPQGCWSEARVGPIILTTVNHKRETPTWIRVWLRRCSSQRPHISSPWYEWHLVGRWTAEVMGQEWTSVLS
ncbi:Intraflagellar Transport Protein 46 [Manis pentadactyla]|nr:Intraflagellar Transport Protein 46 [Manis pentadactyla]